MTMEEDLIANRARLDAEYEEGERIRREQEKIYYQIQEELRKPNHSWAKIDKLNKDFYNVK